MDSKHSLKNPCYGLGFGGFDRKQSTDWLIIKSDLKIPKGPFYNDAKYYIILERVVDIQELKECIKLLMEAKSLILVVPYTTDDELLEAYSEILPKCNTVAFGRTPNRIGLQKAYELFGGLHGVEFTSLLEALEKEELVQRDC